MNNSKLKPISAFLFTGLKFSSYYGSMLIFVWIGPALCLYVYFIWKSYSNADDKNWFKTIFISSEKLEKMVIPPYKSICIKSG